MPPATAQHAGTHRATPIDTQRDRPKVWDDAPLRVKLSLLLVTAAVFGTLVGLVEARLGNMVWPLGLGLIALVVTLLTLGHRWVCRPFEKLMVQWERVSHDRRPNVLRTLPITRQDEIGELARVMFQIGASAIRDSYEARRLRRTLDDRIATATRAATRQLRHLAMRDPLTDLGNRRFLDENLEPLVASVLESNSELAGMMIDMDDFKRINDTLGHAQGDEILIFLASLIRASIRREDYAVRMGGDEFLVLMPGCGIERVREFADHLRALFRQHARTALTESIRADLSIGVAALARDGLTSGRELLEKSDANLFAAKRAGKGRTVGV